MDLQQLEYCYLVEDTDPAATSMKICIPKLMSNISPSNKSQKKSDNTNVLMNANKDELNISPSV